MPFVQGRGEIRQSMAFTALLTVIGTVISLPKEYYRNFVLEEEHGFNKMTRGTFFADQVKTLLLSLGLELPVMAGVVRIIEWVGKDGMISVVAWIMGFM